MLIGCKVKSLVNRMEGNVVDETRNALLVKTEKGMIKVIKDGNRFIINMDNKEIRISGNEIRMRPWEYAI